MSSMTTLMERAAGEEEDDLMPLFFFAAAACFPSNGPTHPSICTHTKVRAGQLVVVYS